MGKDASHRRDLEELSEVIDEMQSESMKKDYEMDELVQKLYQLQESFLIFWKDEFYFRMILNFWDSNTTELDKR